MKGEHGWGALAAGVIAFDLLNEETLSESVDKALERHRLLTMTAIGITALHLANLLPEKIDPFHQALKAVKHG
jgi:hypothetical protein